MKMLVVLGLVIVLGLVASLLVGRFAERSRYRTMIEAVRIEGNVCVEADGTTCNCDAELRRAFKAAIR